MTRTQLIADYGVFRFGEMGIGAFVGPRMHDEVFERLRSLGEAPITKVQLNQLLVLSRAGSISDGFFRYYWLTSPSHPYDVSRLPFFSASAVKDSGQEEVVSHDHLRWGLYRLYLDGLLYFGSVAAAFSALRSKTFEELTAFYAQKRFDTAAISQRGPALALQQIAKDDRYLISEMVCKTFGDVPEDKEEARRLLLAGLKQHKGESSISFRHSSRAFHSPRIAISSYCHLTMCSIQILQVMTI